MKRIFTSISLALCLMASSVTVSAQTAQLSEAQKKEIQKEVLPVVFEQIKEQTGLDILGWAQPQLTQDFIQNLPIFNNLQSGLRADTKEAYSVKPDSITINAAALSPDYGSIVGTVKVAFSDYQNLSIPFEIGGRTSEISLPSLIKVTSSSPLPTFQNLAEIKIVKNENAKALLDIDMTISLWGEESVYPLLGLTVAQNEALAFNFDVEIGEGLTNLLQLIQMVATVPALPADMNYRIVLDVFPVLTGGNLSASLYGIPAKSAEQVVVPMGDAVVALDLAAYLPKSIDVTSYDSVGVANKWSKFFFSMNKESDQSLVMDIDNYQYLTAEKKDSTYLARTEVVMSEYAKNANVADVKSAVQAVLTRAITELATEGEASQYKMSITTYPDSNGDGVFDANDAKVPVADIEVDPVIEGTSAIAKVNVKSYKYNDKGESSTTEMDIIATADLAGSKVIKVDFEQGGKTLASAYFTSNIADIVTGNDNIAVSTVKVTPVDGGIYVSGSSKAVYRIVSMSGATVANGTVSGENAYIPTSSLAKGIYVIVITADGESQSVKFVR